MSERIGVTGSHGFIGGHLVEKLGKYQALDRSGNVPSSVKVLFDLAAYGNMAGHKSEAKETYKANLLRVMNASKDYGGRYIFVSTSSVMLPHQTYYSASKKAAEDFLRIRARDNGLKAAIVRPFSITGVGDQPNHLIPKLIDSCLNGTKMPFVPDPVHDFLDVDDFVDALLTISEKGRFDGEIYQVGSGVQVPNEHVLRTVESVVGKRANVRFVESMRDYDTKHWVADNTAISTLGWKPKKTLADSIMEMVEHARANT